MSGGDNNMDYARERMKAASNGDEAAAVFLRNALADVAQAAPAHSLVKIWQFLLDEIWKDARRESAEQN